MVGPFLVLSRFVLEPVPFGGGAAQQEGGANRHGQCRYGADGSAEVNTLSDRLLLGDPDRSG
jgi:hypothetical protein